jgi:hypothetical protein
MDVHIEESGDHEAALSVDRSQPRDRYCRRRLDDRRDPIVADVKGPGIEHAAALEIDDLDIRQDPAGVLRTKHTDRHRAHDEGQPYACA